MSKYLHKLCELSLELSAKKYPSFPKSYFPKPKYNDKKANGLTKCIIDWINLNGGMAERIGNTGRYLQGSSVTDVIGITRQFKGKFIPGTGTNGTADISATINGMSFKIEVKIGSDRQSDVQKEYQTRIERSGGVYFMAKNFDEFYLFIDKYFSMSK